MSFYINKPNEEQVQIITDRLNNLESPMYTFTATSNNTTNIDFSNVAGLNLLTLGWQAFYKGILLDSDNYTINANHVSLDLTDWSLKTGEKILLKL